MRAFCFVAVAIMASPAWPATLSSEAVEHDIAKHGARETVSRLWSTGEYDKIMDAIDSGDARWIALAPKLAAGADAGAAEELPIALAFALPKNPHAVLNVLLPPNGLPIEDVCGAPFIEGTIKSIPGYVRETERAVAAVSDSRLTEVREACLAQLRAVRP